MRVVLAKVGLDGHDRGIKVVARGLRDAGMHVIYGGIWQSPEAVAQAVADEDADWLGISLLSGAHLSLMPRVLEELRRCGREDVGVVLGGIIPQTDLQTLQEMGVAGVFGPGSPMSDIMSFLNARSPRECDVPLLLEALRRGSRDALSRLLTCLANGQHTALIRDAAAKWSSDPAIQPISASVLAFTGSAGVGKSSLIAGLLSEFRSRKQPVAVLACDPQSPLTAGALLGDRIRMASSLPDSGVFIRSIAVPSGCQGIPKDLDLMVGLFSLHGFENVIIETVGTGQGDVAVREVADQVVVLLQPEAGDSIQWEKAGVLEIADVIVIHKSDLPGCESMAAQLREYFSMSEAHAVPVVAVSSSRHSGLEDLYDVLKHPRPKEIAR